MASNFKIDVLIKGVTNLTKVASSVKGSTDKIVRSFGKMDKSAKDNKKSFNSLNSSIDKVTRLLATGLVAALVAVTAAGMQFQTSVADLSALTGIQGEGLKTLSDNALKMSTTYGVSASKVAIATKLVASAKSELIGVSGALELVTENALILSKAARLDLSTATNAMTISLNQFNFGAEEARRVINVLAIGAKLGASEITDTAQAMIRAGVAMRLTGVSFEQGNAAIQVLAKNGLKGVIAGTQLKTTLLRLQTQTDLINPKVVGLNQALDNLAAANLNGAELTRLFGLEALAAGTILIENRALIARWTKEFTGTNEAIKQATINMKTLLESSRRLGAAITLHLISTFNRMEPTLTRVANKMEVAISVLSRDPGSKVGKRIRLRIKIFGALIAILAAAAIQYKIWFITQQLITMAPVIQASFLFKAVILLTAAIKTSILWTSTWIMTLTGAFLGAMRAATAAVWSFTAAILLSPWTWLVIAVLAVIATVSVATVKFKSWGAALLIFMGPLGQIVILIKTFQKHWNAIKEGFSAGGIKAGLIEIGKTLVDAVLMPVAQLLDLMSKLPGKIGEIAREGADAARSLSEKLGVETNQEIINSIVTPNTSQTLEVDMKIDSEGRPEIEKIESPDSSLIFNIDLGHTTALAGAV